MTSMELKSGNPGINSLSGSSLTLTTFKLNKNSDGTFACQGGVNVTLHLPGNYDVSTSFGISLDASGRVKVSGGPTSVNLGFHSVDLSGWFDSDGHYSFTGSASVDVGRYKASTLSVTLSDSTQFSGHITGPFGLDASVDSSGRFTYLRVTLQI